MSDNFLLSLVFGLVGYVTSVSVVVMSANDGEPVKAFLYTLVATAATVAVTSVLIKEFGLL